MGQNDTGTTQTDWGTVLKALLWALFRAPLWAPIWAHILGIARSIPRTVLGHIAGIPPPKKTKIEKNVK